MEDDKKMEEEIKMKHLEFIQSIITRMNTNSFQIKSWAVAIVSALLALYADSEKIYYIYLAIFPTLIFGLLDAYYLHQERKYRELYKEVIQEESKVERFDLNAKDYKKGLLEYFKALFSRTIAPLYGCIIVALIIAGIIAR